MAIQEETLSKQEKRFMAEKEALENEATVRMDRMKVINSCYVLHKTTSQMFKKLG